MWAYEFRIPSTLSVHSWLVVLWIMVEVSGPIWLLCVWICVFHVVCCVISTADFPWGWKQPVCEAYCSPKSNVDCKIHGAFPAMSRSCRYFKIQTVCTSQYMYCIYTNTHFIKKLCPELGAAVSLHLQLSMYRMILIITLTLITHLITWTEV